MTEFKLSSITDVNDAFPRGKYHTEVVEDSLLLFSLQNVCSSFIVTLFGPQSLEFRYFCPVLSIKVSTCAFVKLLGGRGRKLHQYVEFGLLEFIRTVVGIFSV